MIKYPGARINRPGKTGKYYLWLVTTVSLLAISIQACQPVGRVRTQTASVSARPTLPVTATASFVPVTTPIVTVTPAGNPPTVTNTETPSATNTSTIEPSATNVPPVIFAAIGDFDSGDQAEAAVANEVLSWKPDFIITLGDNTYPDGAADHIDQAIGQFYHSYIYPYTGSYGAGTDVNRFFPCLGNHDLITNNGQAYYDYFTLPGNERYYDFSWGPVHLFALDDLETEPDGVGATSVQAQWLKAGLSASTAEWNIVYMHYPPYSSGSHGSTDWARWPYKEWGADAVLAGHDHTYERLQEAGLTYFVNGLGGGGIYKFPSILDGSQVRYNADYGAMRIEATQTWIRFEFINRNGEVVDTYQLDK